MRLTAKSLRVIARDHGVKDYFKMKKHEFVNVLQSKDIVLDNLRKVELTDIAKSYSIPDYKKMNKAELVEAIHNSHLEKVSIPTYGPEKPTSTNIKGEFTTLEKTLLKAEDSVTDTLNKTIDWFKSKLPTSVLKKQVKQKIARVKRNINAFHSFNKFKPKLREKP